MNLNSGQINMISRAVQVSLNICCVLSEAGMEM